MHPSIRFRFQQHFKKAEKPFTRSYLFGDGMPTIDKKILQNAIMTTP